VHGGQAVAAGTAKRMGVDAGEARTNVQRLGDCGGGGVRGTRE
jgi:hypothetical protein